MSLHEQLNPHLGIEHRSLHLDAMAVNLIHWAESAAITGKLNGQPLPQLIESLRLQQAYDIALRQNHLDNLSVNVRHPEGIVANYRWNNPGNGENNSPFFTNFQAEIFLDSGQNVLFNIEITPNEYTIHTQASNPYKNNQQTLLEAKFSHQGKPKTKTVIVDTSVGGKTTSEKLEA